MEVPLLFGDHWESGLLVLTQNALRHTRERTRSASRPGIESIPNHEVAEVVAELVWECSVHGIQRPGFLTCVLSKRGHDGSSCWSIIAENFPTAELSYLTMPGV